MSVYLIHFERPYKHARHYLGWASRLLRRLRRHGSGEGARRMQVVTQAGIGWHVARVWPGADRAFERKLKNIAHPTRICPICNPKLSRHRARSAKWPSHQGSAP